MASLGRFLARGASPQVCATGFFSSQAAGSQTVTFGRPSRGTGKARPAPASGSGLRRLLAAKAATSADMRNRHQAAIACALQQPEKKSICGGSNSVGDHGELLDYLVGKWEQRWQQLDARQPSGLLGWKIDLRNP